MQQCLRTDDASNPSNSPMQHHNSYEVQYTMLNIKTQAYIYVMTANICVCAVAFSAERRHSGSSDPGLGVVGLWRYCVATAA